MLVLEGLVSLHRTGNFSFFSISGWGIDLNAEWFALGITEIILLFLRLHLGIAFWTLLLVDCEGYSVSSKGFLPTVVYIICI